MVAELISLRAHTVLCRVLNRCFLLDRRHIALFKVLGHQRSMRYAILVVVNIVRRVSVHVRPGCLVRTRNNVSSLRVHDVGLAWYAYRVLRHVLVFARRYVTPSEVLRLVLARTHICLVS